MKMNIGQLSNDGKQKTYPSCNCERKKFSEVLYSIFHVDSDLQKCDFLFRNGPNGLGPYDQNLSVWYGGAQKHIRTLVGSFWTILEFSRGSESYSVTS